MSVRVRTNKTFGKNLDEIQRVNARIVACPHYACAIPGQIFCIKKQKFVTLEICATCRREG